MEQDTEKTTTSAELFPVQALVMTVVSGLATVLGGTIVFLFKKPSDKKNSRGQSSGETIVALLLAFAAGVMLHVSFFELLIEATESIGAYNANMAFFGGIAFFGLVMTLLPEDHDHSHSHGKPPSRSKRSHESSSDSTDDALADVEKDEEGEAEGDSDGTNIEPEKEKEEHEGAGRQLYTVSSRKASADLRRRGSIAASTTSTTGPATTTTSAIHSSIPKAKKAHKHQKDHNSSLHRVGLATVAGMILHKFPEGIAVYISCLKGLQVGLPLTLAMALHNVPEGMAIVSPIYYATGDRWRAFKLALISAMCEPAGALILGVVMHPYLSGDIIHMLLAGVAGIMTLLSLHQLLPHSYGTAPHHHVTTAVIGGMVFIFGTTHLFEKLFAA